MQHTIDPNFTIEGQEKLVFMANQMLIFRNKLPPDAKISDPSQLGKFDLQTPMKTYLSK
jgi:hypothetical protein